MKTKDLLIIIPAYNEEKDIPKVLNQLNELNITEIADILVIDDASTDFTERVVKSHHYGLISHVFNMGYGSALQVGYRYAVRNDYRYVIQMDADGQHDACNIPTIYHALQEAHEDGSRPDIVLASRFMEESTFFRVSVLKKIAYRIFRTLLYLITGKKICDPTTGLQGLSRRAFLYYSKQDHFDDKYPDANMIMQMILLGFHVVQIPGVMHTKAGGHSMHSGIKPLWYMFRMFFSMMTILFRIKVLHIDTDIEIEGGDHRVGTR